MRSLLCRVKSGRVGGTPRRKRGIGACAWFTGVLWLATLASPAFAYRPFDGTDAAVADEHEFEIELEPLGHLREGSRRSWIAPAAVINYGLANDREIVLEGKVFRTIGTVEAGDYRTSLEDTALSLKQVHRRGSLQDGTGVSIASECGVLLPTLHGERSSGASCALIASQRWDVATVHLNGSLLFGRDHRWSRSAGVIVEGPDKWPVRPVAEVFSQQVVGGAHTISGLLGLIWRNSEHLSFDAGLRRARTGDEKIQEVRMGLTWAFSTGR